MSISINKKFLCILVSLFLVVLLIPVGAVSAFGQEDVKVEVNQNDDLSGEDLDTIVNDTSNGLSAKVVLSLDREHVYFYYDTKPHNKNVAGVWNIKGYNTNVAPEYQETQPWWAECNGAKYVHIDKSFASYKPTNLSAWFMWFGKVTSDHFYNIQYINTSAARTMTRMFNGASKLTSLNLSSFNTSNCYDMTSMFQGCTSLSSPNLSKFNTANVGQALVSGERHGGMSHMFQFCEGLRSLNLSNFNTSHVRSMESMFYQCKNIQSLNITSFSIASCKNLFCMFYDCKSLISLDLSSFGANVATDIRSMFFGCSSLQSISISNMQTKYTNCFDNMFNNCQSLTSLNLYKFTWGNNGRIRYMFFNCKNLKKISVAPGTDLKAKGYAVGSRSESAFGTDDWPPKNILQNLKGEKGTMAKDIGDRGAEYARIDGLHGKKGYFSTAPRPSYKVTVNLAGGSVKNIPSGWKKSGSTYYKNFLDGTAISTVEKQWSKAGIFKKGYYFRGWSPVSGKVTSAKTIKAVWGKRGQCAIGNGTYIISSSINPNKAVDVAGSSKANCGNILLWDYNGGKNQKWKVTIDSKDGFARIQNINSGKYLDVEGGKIYNGANVCQYQATGGDNQKWEIRKSKFGGYVIVSKVNSRFRVDLGGGSTANGANILMWKANGGKNQSFGFYNLSPKVAASDKNIINGRYKLVSKASYKLVADVYGASKANGARSNVYYNGGKGKLNQVFAIKRVGNYHMIINVYSGKALDVSGGSVIPGAQVIQWKANSKDKNQLWSIKKQKDGTYIIQNVGSGLLFDIEGGAKASAYNCGWYNNGGANQRWRLSKV